MKKVLVFILPVLIIGGLVASYLYWWKPGRVEAWSFVPDNAIAVFQPVDLGSMLVQKDSRKILANLKSLPEAQKLLNEISILDSIGRSMDASGELLDHTNMLISMHPGISSASSLANLYIIEIDHMQLHDYFSRVGQYMVLKRDFSKTERVYHGYTITEYRSSETELAYILYQNYLIASFSPFLVDDAIRTMEKNIKNPIYSSEEMKLAMNQKLIGEGRMYLNSQLLARYIDKMIDSERYDLSWLKWFSHLLHLDLTIADDRVDFAGFALLDKVEKNYLSAYNGVRGVSFDMKNVIPDHASLVLHTSFDDINKWYSGLKAYWKKRRPTYLTQMGEVENKYNFDTKRFFELCNDELGMFVLDSKRSFVHEKIFALEHTDRIVMERMFTDLSKATHGDSAVVVSSYAGRNISFIDIEELPSRMFGHLFSGFPETYFMVSDRYLYLASSQHALETLIDDIDNENTWQKSIRSNKFLESTNDDANFSIYTKGTGYWSMIEEILDPAWGNYINEHKLVFNQIEYGAVQFTNVDDNYYTNISFQHPGRLLEKQQVKNFEIKSQRTFDTPLISKPYAVRSHKDRSLEMMVQDSLYNLYLVKSDLKIDLTIPLKGPLRTPVYQVDYYKNGKLQYLFALDHSIHMIDRTGTYIPGYPVKVPADPVVKYMTLMDYDKSKDYRIMVATEKSYYYLYNKAGKLLKGWNPKKLTGGPAMGGQHIRVRNSDFMMFVQDDGIVHALSRKGLGKKGFPIDLKSNISSPLNITKRATLSDTEVVAVTNTGELIEFNLLGGVVRKDQFYKESVGDVFRLVNASDGAGYMVYKLSGLRLTLFNDNLEELFNVELSSTDFDIQYYQFSPGNELLIVVDKAHNLCSLYDMSGHMLHEESIATGHKLAVLLHKSKGQYEIFCSLEDKLSILTLTL